MSMDVDLSLNDLLTHCPSRLEKIFSHYLSNVPALELKSAMEYTLFTNGKRIRPLLIYATGLVFNASWNNLDLPASSVELIHTYSLIHDDLPSMDNSDIRRGKPSCHKAFDEGIAILAGDALHTLAMQILASHPAPLKADKRAHLVKVLSKACGPSGMAAGQAMDITLMDSSISTDLLEEIYKLKTGALFTACIELGLLCSDEDDEIHQRALKQFGDCIGLAFQIQDDILDIEIESEVLGKPQGIDTKNKKITYPKLHGLTTARERVEALYLSALESINYLGPKAQLLRELAAYMLARKR